MDKKYLIAGGAGVVIVGIFLYAKMNDDGAQASAPSAQVLPEMGYFSSLAPSSGGMSSGGGSSAATGNSGLSDVGGGMEMADVFKAMFAGQTEVNKLGIITNGHNYDSSVLASIVGANGTASVSHSATGTIVTNTPGADAYEQIINDIYKNELKRAPDKGGLAYWKNALMNNNQSVSAITGLVQSSSEAQTNQIKSGSGAPWSSGMINHVNSGGTVDNYQPPAPEPYIGLKGIGG